MKIAPVARDAVRSAVAAGLLTVKGSGTFASVRVGALEVYRDGSDLAHKPAGWEAAYNAWSAASDYRKANRAVLGEGA